MHTNLIFCLNSLYTLVLLLYSFFKSIDQSSSKPARQKLKRSILLVM